MPLQGSGTISLSDIQTEFGGTNPILLSEYYGAASGVPTEGTISLGDFYGKSSALTVTMKVWGGGGLAQPSESKVGGGAGASTGTAEYLAGTVLRIVVGGVTSYSGVFVGAGVSWANSLLIAGGGGNASSDGNGGVGGGLTGGSGSGNAGGGSQSAGGSGGTVLAENGTSGSKLVGGFTADTESSIGGDGGSGYFGGGGGSTSTFDVYAVMHTSSGAGGSGYKHPSLTAATLYSGSGSTSGNHDSDWTSPAGNSNSNGSVKIWKDGILVFNTAVPGAYTYTV